MGPRRVGALEEPHHNTYDIEFWGADGMCTSFYAGALHSFIKLGQALNEDVSQYESLLAKAKTIWKINYMTVNTLSKYPMARSEIT